MSKKIDALCVPSEWHRFLYRSVLLEWEVSLQGCQEFPRFNSRKPLHGIELVKVIALKDMNPTLLRMNASSKPVDRLVFYSTETALKDLFRLLRNSVAHANYSCPRRGWIEFHPGHNGKVKLSGLVKFEKLKNLIASISCQETYSMRVDISNA